MPRGYLKHKKEVGKKKARGGSSGRGYIAEKDSDPARSRGAVEDFVLTTATTNDANKKTTSQHPSTATIGECSICFKEAPLVCLSNKCKWHEAACRQCLHHIYVTNAPKYSYPLTCFHPLCNQPVHAAQLEKHSIFASADEVRKHHEMLVLSKIQKTEGMKTVHCPKCNTPRGIGRLGDVDKIFGCRNCKSKYQVSPCFATIRALENMKEDNIGMNDGWAKCPHCGILISKGDGCDHMWCIYCNQEFCWAEAQEKNSRLLHARVPMDEIHLWW